MIHPASRLRFELDPEQLTDEVVADLKRCYLNVAPVHIGPRAEIKDGRIAKNILGLVVVLYYPYWDEADESAQANWDDVIIPWLKRKLFKLNATVQNYNSSRRKSFIPMIQYGQLEIVLGERMVSIQLPGDSVFPEVIPELVDRFRTLDVAGAFGPGNVVRVEMPWIDPEAIEEEVADEIVSDEVVADEVVADEAVGEEVAVEADEDKPAEPELEPLPDHGKEIDYSLWGVRFTDGTLKLFDSVNGVWK